MNIQRRKTRRLVIGTVPVGNGAPIAIQSMTNTDTRDTEATVRQIRRLERAGCEIIRVGVPSMDAARNLNSIKKRIRIPLVADIHFDHRLALEALRQGADGLRLNPGNIGFSCQSAGGDSSRCRTGCPNTNWCEFGLSREEIPAEIRRSNSRSNGGERLGPHRSFRKRELLRISKYR